MNQSITHQKNSKMRKITFGCTSAVRHMVLLMTLLFGFGLAGVYAQTPTGGLYMHKDWVVDSVNCPNGDCGYIRLETFVTGDKIITETHVPTDIVLVLDVSGSMDETINNYQYIARPSQGYSYDGYGYNTYYYLHTDGNYYAVQRQRYQYGGSWLNPRYYYRLRFQVNGTYYYLSGTGVTTTAPTNVTNENTTIWTGVLYTYELVSSQTKMKALQDAVCLFVDNIAADAEQFNVDHRISIIKFAIDEFYGSASSLAEGNHFGATGSTGASADYNYNYTEVVINRRKAKDDAEDLKDAVNGLVARGATAADYGMNKARYLLASIKEGTGEGYGEEEFNTRSKVVVMFTDGAPTYASNFQNAVANSTINFAHDLKHSANNLLAPYNGKTYQFDATVFTVGVFESLTTNINTYMSRTSSNYPEATSMTNTCVQESENYYFTAESADALSDIFEAIAQESGGAEMQLGSETVVQDVISPSFQLNIPEDVTNPDLVIKAYAPKCIGKDGDRFTFEPEIDGDGYLAIGDSVVDGETIHGVVTGGAENRLEEGIVHYDSDTKTL